jgi:hypothetical protein
MLSEPNQNLSSWNRSPLERPQEALRYLPKFSTFLIASRTGASTVFCQLIVTGCRRACSHLLLRLLLLRERLLLLALSKELSLLRALSGLGLGEVRVVDGFGKGDRGDVDLGRCSDNVGLADSSEGDTVQPVCQYARMCFGCR